MRRLSFALVLVALGTTLALAQSTGGTMGGGDWSSSPSSSSHSSGNRSSSWSSSGGWSSPSSSSSKSSWSWSSSKKKSSWQSSDDDATRSTYRYDPTPSPPIDWAGTRTVFFVLGLALTVLFLLGLAVKAFADRNDALYEPSPALSEFGDPGTLGASLPLPGGVDVTVLRVALDGRARKFIQTELAQIANTSDTATTEGRVAMLVQVTLLLRRVRDAWVYGGAHNEPMSPIAAAKRIFDQHVDDARTRFMNETISNVDGQRSRGAAPDIAPRGDEGPGLILVSIILAARSELVHVFRIGDGEDLRKALESASYLTERELVAVEIVWMPSEDDDRMSSLEHEAKYPKPQLIPIRGALVGKTFCTYCAGPFPAELVSCPHCGAPAPGRDRDRTAA